VDASFDAPSVSHLEKALKLDPDLTEAHYSLGDFYFRKHQMLARNGEEGQAADARKKALAHFEKFIAAKQNSKSKYYLWKVKKAKRKVGKLKS
jgi:tetratricopeptide (TPR) repeat protein